MGFSQGENVIKSLFMALFVSLICGSCSRKIVEMITGKKPFLQGLVINAVLHMFLFTPLQAQSVFDSYFRSAQSFALSYPQEKAYLHFDNTSYYQGDTIWFKAYVVMAADNKPTTVSKPLYVELLDQLGNRLEKNTIKIENGEGSGRFVLADAFFTGYYEVRAYTKWMLAFEEPQYFSRVLPVYRKRVGSRDEARQIATYRSLDKSMKQRPVEKEKKFCVMFYPEGGNLVQGVRSTVGFEAVSRDSGAVNVGGALYSSKGERLSPLRAFHDGRGSFSYTPAEKAGYAEFTFDGRPYRFDLPKALPEGYVLHADHRGDCVDVTLSRSSAAMNDTLAVFLSCRGVPVRYADVDFKGGLSCRLRFSTADIPAGVACFTLLNTAGQTLADRFCFVNPRDTMALACETDKNIYSPYERIKCRLTLRDSSGKPVRNVSLSVSVRDAMESDYREYDNTIMTDLLLTSELKGYIDRPGFYFRENTARSRMLLDQLMLVRGWRRYDMQALIGRKPFTPRFMPEKTLVLHGRVKSLFNHPQSNIGVSVMARRDSVFLAGSTTADDEGYFNIPVDGFEGDMETVFQTRRQGKKYNRWSRVSLFRNFEPELRAYTHAETNPEWDELLDMRRFFARGDSADADALLGGSKRLGETVVTAKRRTSNLLAKTETFEREIIGYYNVKEFVSRMADEGRPVYLLDDVLYELNHDIVFHMEKGIYLYKAQQIQVFVNSKYASFSELYDSYNKIENLLLYRDFANTDVFSIDSLTFRRKSVRAKEFYSDFEIPNFGGPIPYVVASFQMSPGWDVEKRNKPRRGIRITDIQGYEQPKEFYSPIYVLGQNQVYADKRRTLYWNPAVKTDDDGVAEIECFNNSTLTTITVTAETLNNGVTTSKTFNTMK